MAINAAFAARTTDGASSGYAATGATVLVELQKDSVLDGAHITVEACTVNTAGKYAKVLNVPVLTRAGVVAIPTVSGTFFRVVQSRSGLTSSLNVNIVT